MAMAMRAAGDVEIGQHITPPLSPLAYSLHHSFLHSHCSSCFSPLPDPPFSPTDTHRVCYCSPLCSSSDSPLHFSSAEFQLLSSLAPDSDFNSELRVALRLLHSFSSSSPFQSGGIGRVSGLLTNRDKLIADPEISERMREGARVMKAARRGKDGEVHGNRDEDELLVEEEAAICLVLTNSVEVRDSEGRCLGIAVYGSSFSWINHSCSPNAFYLHSISPSDSPPSAGHSRMRIVPSSSKGEDCVCSDIDLAKGCSNHGPKVIVRSIKRIKKGEEIRVAYIDVLQPKKIRQSELWSKYCFVCSCARCIASPECYVDHALQEISASYLNSLSVASDHDLFQAEVAEKLADYVDEVIMEYVSTGDATHCCNKLENILIHGLLDEQLDTNVGNSQVKFWLHPLHYLALNAYTTLASAYKVRASNLLDHHSEYAVQGHQLEVFDLSRTSAAYSLLLACATYHLFCFESSLIASVANFWVSAGESLLSLARSSGWSLLGKRGLPVSNFSSFVEQKCPKCSFLDKHDVYFSLDKVQNADPEDISREFHDCITSLSEKVWNSLIQHCDYLQMFKAVDFRLLGKSSKLWDFDACLSGKLICRIKDGALIQAQAYTDEGRMNLFQLGVHCLLFGGILGSTCYGEHSHLISHIQRILHTGGI